MRTSIKSFVSLCASSFLASGLALADIGHAVSIDGFGCGLRDADGTFVAVEYSLVSANSANGNITLTCSHDFAYDVPLKRSKIWNFDNTDEGVCGVGGGKTTEDWHQVISARGKAKLSCHYKVEAE